MLVAEPRQSLLHPVSARGRFGIVLEFRQVRKLDEMPLPGQRGQHILTYHKDIVPVIGFHLLFQSPEIFSALDAFIKDINGFAVIDEFRHQ